MEKLPHERLREDGLYNYITDEECSVTACSKCEQFVANKIADEIEKYYTPRPRFEDGEPIQIGDAFIQKCINEEVELDKIGIILFAKDGLNMVWFTDEVVQRPESKVLDADGVEIKVGVTVFENNSPIPLKVVTVYGDGDICAVGDRGICSKLDSSNYSHREPDSLEKILDDLTAYRENQVANNDTLIKIEFRLAAIMERDV